MAEKSPGQIAYEAYWGSTERLTEITPWERAIGQHKWEAAALAVALAERERIYAELGSDHYVIFTQDGWTTEHSLECRLSGQMSRCAWHEAVRRVAATFDPRMAGRWRITGISEGLPELELADG